MSQSSAGLGKVIAIALSTVMLILGAITLVELTKGSGAEDEQHHLVDSVSSYKAGVAFDGKEGVSDTLRGIIRVVGEKKFQNAFR